jgi:hypothetical protein
MAQFVASRWINRPVRSAGWASEVKSEYGSFEWGAANNPSIADTVIMCKLPKGALIIGGLLSGDKIETTSVGSGLLSINIGFDVAALLPSGVTLNAASASNALASNWTLGSDVLTGPYGLANSASLRAIPLGALLYSEGPLLLQADANVIITVGASTFAITTGTMNLRVDYVQVTHT